MPTSISTQWGEIPLPDNATDDQIDAAIDAFRTRQAQPSQQQTPSFGRDLLGQLQTNIASIPDQARALWSMMHRRPDPTSPTGYTGGLSSVGDELLKGLGGGLRQQQIRAGQEISNGHPIYGSMRSLVGGIVPGLGPATMNIIDRSFGQGPYQGHPSPGAATADALTLGAQMALPELWKGAMAPLRNAGGNLVSDALGFPANQINPSVDELTALARATRATASKSTQQDLADLISTAQGNVNDDIIQRMLATHPQLKTTDLIQPMVEQYATYIRSGDESMPAAQQLLKKIEDFQNKHGATLNLAQANEQKSLTWNLLNDKTFQKTLQETPGLEQALLLRGRGLKRGIEEEFGPGSRLAENNNITQVAMTLKKQIDGLSNDKKSMLARWLPRGMGVMAGAGAAAAGGGYGSPWMIGGAIGAAGMANYITRLAMQDPKTLLNLGQFMSDIGEGAAAKAITNLPKIGLAGILQGKQSTKTQAQPEQLKIPGISPPSLDIQNEIQKAAKAIGLDPRLAMEVARQESNFRQFDKTGQVLQGQDAQGNHSNARGVFQLMPDTAREMGVDAGDTLGNIRGGTRYLKKMLDRAHGDIPMALAAYHDGPTAMFDNKADLSDEGQLYLDAILGRLGK